MRVTLEKGTRGLEELNGVLAAVSELGDQMLEELPIGWIGGPVVPGPVTNGEGNTDPGCSRVMEARSSLLPLELRLRVALLTCTPRGLPGFSPS